jgi:hypothetical protein
VPQTASPSLRSTGEKKYLDWTEEFRGRKPSLRVWAEAFRLEQGEPLDFATFPFQVELYKAFGDKTLRTVDVMKSAQCGISAAGVSLALYAGDVWEANVLYVLPVADDAYDFSDTRVKPSIEDSIYLSRRVASTDNKGLKRVGNANLYFRGSGSEKKALSIPADVLILDELDRLDHRNVPKFRKRLSSPKSLKLERRFSNPSFPEDGIHRLFLDSDQREWLVTCPGCNAEEPVYYDGQEGAHRVDPERGSRVCSSCAVALEPGDVAAGRWVPRYPDVGARGYHISKLIVPTQSIPELVAEHARTVEDEIAAHYNFDLGLPYAPRGGSLDRATVLSCRRDYTPPDSYRGDEWITAGVDVGSLLHVRVSRWLEDGSAAPLFVGEVHDFSELGLLWDRYNVNFGLVDERPEERAARAFMHAYTGRCMLIRWSGEEQRDDIVTDDDNGLVIARRTWSCDKTVSAFSLQQRLLARDVSEAYLSQVTAPHRIVETTARGQKVARYVSERADHYFFAETHDLIAFEVRGGAAIDIATGHRMSIREEIARKRGRR